MIYDISDVQIEKLLIAAARAGEALARLDERIDRSPMKHGFIASATGAGPDTFRACESVTAIGSTSPTGINH